MVFFNIITSTGEATEPVITSPRLNSVFFEYCALTMGFKPSFVDGICVSLMIHFCIIVFLG